MEIKISNKIKYLVGGIFIVLVFVGLLWFFHYFFIYCPGRTIICYHAEGIVVDYYPLNRTILYQPRQCDDKEYLNLYSITLSIPTEEAYIIWYENDTCCCEKNYYVNKSYVVAFDIPYYYEYQEDTFSQVLSMNVRFTGAMDLTENIFRVWHYEPKS